MMDKSRLPSRLLRQADEPQPVDGWPGVELRATHMKPMILLHMAPPIANAAGTMVHSPADSAFAASLMPAAPTMPAPTAPHS